ncbi:CLUMA_CG009904, isoform A [Clunio marinus]|uniref:CLUMA_CG009904, isoform A n=1 Tax=Clunio marinus TaxID=568069 RepID=A0A1J1IB68_9DIPT|nr:CLUMA_CG009904, isoform A [Clunio marinus]
MYKETNNSFNHSVFKLTNTSPQIYFAERQSPKHKKRQIPQANRSSKKSKLFYDEFSDVEHKHYTQKTYDDKSYTPERPMSVKDENMKEENDFLSPHTPDLEDYQNKVLELISNDIRAESQSKTSGELNRINECPENFESRNNFSPLTNSSSFDSSKVYDHRQIKTKDKTFSSNVGKFSSTPSEETSTQSSENETTKLLVATLLKSVKLVERKCQRDLKRKQKEYRKNQIISEVQKLRLELNNNLDDNLETRFRQLDARLSDGLLSKKSNFYKKMKKRRKNFSMLSTVNEIIIKKGISAIPNNSLPSPPIGNPPKHIPQPRIKINPPDLYIYLNVNMEPMIELVIPDNITMADHHTPHHAYKGKLVEQKIKRLTVLKETEQKHYIKNSPSFRHLQSEPSRVKMLSQLFEEHSRTHATVLANKFVSKSQPSSPTSYESPKARSSLGNSPAKSSSKLDRIINELLQKELSYLQALERGIQYYVRVIKAGNPGVPEILKNQTFRLFGNIEEIYKLHKNSVYPRLLIANGNARQIAETLNCFITNDLFYCYIIYAINQKTAEQLISSHYNFFEDLRSTSDDFLGIHSFVIQPIQKLPRYKMFLDEIIKELMRQEMTAINKEILAICCVAEKNVQRLLVRLNEALSINDIIETHEFSATVQVKVMSAISHDYGVDCNDMAPVMLIVPKNSSHFQFRVPFNVFSLGKFIKCSTFKAIEDFLNRKFTSKVFIFEKCFLYTKVINNNVLGYRNHFFFGASFSFVRDDRDKFKIGGVSKKHDVTFSSDNIESIAEIKKIIDQLHNPRRSGDSAFVEGSELMISEDQDILTTDDDNDEDEEWVVTESQANFEDICDLAIQNDPYRQEDKKDFRMF